MKLKMDLIKNSDSTGEIFENLSLEKLSNAFAVIFEKNEIALLQLSVQSGGTIPQKLYVEDVFHQLNNFAFKV